MATALHEQTALELGGPAAGDGRLMKVNQVSWGAVFAGAVLALVASLVLNMIGLGLGVATLDPGTSDNPAASTLSIGAGIWWVVSGIVASAAGGYLAGRLSGNPTRPAIPSRLSTSPTSVPTTSS